MRGVGRGKNLPHRLLLILAERINRFFTRFEVVDAENHLDWNYVNRKFQLLLPFNMTANTGNGVFFIFDHHCTMLVSMHVRRSQSFHRS